MGVDAALLRDNVDVFVSGNLYDRNSRELDRVLTRCDNRQRWNWIFHLHQQRHYELRGGPRNSDSLLRWDPDPGKGVWHATEETELSC